MDPKSTLTLQERMALTAIAPTPKIDRYTGKLACHRFMIPANFMTPDPIDPKSAKLNLHMGHVSCIGIKCSLWNEDDKECYDATNAKSAKSTARILEMMDGHARLSASEK